MFRYAVFIDGGYIKKVLQQFGTPRISYLRFSEEVANGEERLRTYYYDCPPFVSPNPVDDDKKRQRSFDGFRKALEREPRFQVRLGRLSKHLGPGGNPVFRQKMVDILLTCDILKLSLEKQISRAVLVAGDSDYVPAIQIARDAGVVVQLYYCRKPLPHDQLLEACDERVCIDQSLIDKIRT